MTLEINTATPDDGIAIATLKGVVWPDETPRLDHILKTITHPDHVTHVARAPDGQVVAFVDGFVTVAASGLIRWEIDLLAVDPAFQGQKIGQQLIAASTQAGQNADAALARALIQVENFASQGAFRRSKFRITGSSLRLMVSDQTMNAASDSGNPYLIPVQTMHYRGLWLEGDYTAAHLAAAQAAGTKQSVDLVGVLIPLRATDLMMEARRLGYRMVEHFHWWTQALAE